MRVSDQSYCREFDSPSSPFLLLDFPLFFIQVGVSMRCYIMIYRNESSYTHNKERAENKFLVAKYIAAGTIRSLRRVNENYPKDSMVG